MKLFAWLMLLSLYPCFAFSQNVEVCYVGGSFLRIDNDKDVFVYRNGNWEIATYNPNIDEGYLPRFSTTDKYYWYTYKDNIFYYNFEPIDCKKSVTFCLHNNRVFRNGVPILMKSWSSSVTKKTRYDEEGDSTLAWIALHQNDPEYKDDIERARQYLRKHERIVYDSVRTLQAISDVDIYSISVAPDNNEAIVIGSDNLIAYYDITCNCFIKSTSWSSNANNKFSTFIFNWDNRHGIIGASDGLHYFTYTNTRIRRLRSDMQLSSITNIAASSSFDSIFVVVGDSLVLISSDNGEYWEDKTIVIVSNSKNATSVIVNYLKDVHIINIIALIMSVLSLIVSLISPSLKRLKIKRKPSFIFKRIKPKQAYKYSGIICIILSLVALPVPWSLGNTYTLFYAISASFFMACLVNFNSYINILEKEQQETSEQDQEIK